MAKIQSQALERQFHDLLIQIVRDIRNTSEAKAFVDEFLTPTEVQSILARLAIAYNFKKGRTANNITTNTGLTLQEIRKVSDLLDLAGYKLVVRKMEAEEFASKWTTRIKKITSSKV